MLPSRRMIRSRLNPYQLSLELLEPRAYLATLAAFDGGADTPYVATVANDPAGPVLVAGGTIPEATANLLQLVRGVPDDFNSIAFNRTDPGKYDRIVSDFDFRLNQVNERPDGLTFALANTATFGVAGPISPTGTDPQLAGSLSASFDSFQHATDPSTDSVKIYYNSQLVTQVDVATRFDLAGGEWIHARMVMERGQLTVSLTPANGQVEKVIDRLTIPAYAPFESRAMFSGWSGGAAWGSADIDNVNIQYLKTSQAYVSLRPLSITVGEQSRVAYVNVERRGNVSSAVAIQYSTVADSAVANADFTPKSGTLLFAPNQTLATIAIPVIDDSLREVQEQFVVRLSAPSAGAVLAGATAMTITIVDDEQLRAIGDFGPLTPIPNVMIHAIMLPTGEVLSFDQVTGHHNGWLWNPITKTSRPTAQLPLNEQLDHQVHIFCSGHALLADGRVIFAGGHKGFVENGHAEGLLNVTIYDPYKDTWQSLPLMEHGRWYPTVLVRPNGDVLVMGGYDETGTNTINSDMELYHPLADGTWTRRVLDMGQDAADNAQANSGYLYPKMIQAADGRIFVIEGGNRTWWLNVEAEGTPNVWTRGPDTIAAASRNDYGNAVLVNPTKLILIGGGGDLEGAVPQNNVEMIDLSQPNPKFKAMDPMPGLGRRQINSTVLPNGDIVVTGGTTASTFSDGSGSAHQALLFRSWAPAGSQWQMLDTAQADRLYHSTALLLPSGEVLTSGTGQPHYENYVDQRNVEVYSPGYMGIANHPTIASADAAWQYGASTGVSVTSKFPISQVVLMRPSAITHTLEEGARRIPLTWQAGTKGTLSVQVPNNMNAAPPGYYMLFVLDSRGVPSAAKWIQLLPSATASMAKTASALTSTAVRSTVATRDTSQVLAALGRIGTDGVSTPSDGTSVKKAIAQQATTDSLGDTIDILAQAWVLVPKSPLIGAAH